MAMIQWISTTSTNYAAIETKDADALYFLEDTQEIYKGTKSFSSSVVVVDAFPTTGIKGRLYIIKSPLEGKIYDGGAWVNVLATSGGGSVTISPDAGNMIIKKGNGIYVAATDITGKLDKVTTAKTDEVITANSDGTVKTSGLKAGGATLSATPNSTTLATEAAIAAALSWQTV